MDEALAARSLTASSVKDSSSSFFCHHLLPSVPSLVFLSPSLLSFTVRKDYLWRDNSVPSCTGKDGGPQTLLQWVTLTAGGNHKDKIRAPVGFDTAVLFPELLELMPSVCVNFWTKDMGLFAYNKCHILGVCYENILSTSSWHFLVCFLALSCVACVHEPCI